MRHRKYKFLLNRFSSYRKATLKSLAKSLLIYQRITTTKTKAKAVRGLVEHLITLSKRGDLSAKRQAYNILGEHSLVKRIFSEIAPLFKERTGGYTRLILSGNRRGDNAEMAILELTEKIPLSKPAPKEKIQKPKTPKETQEQREKPPPPKPKEIKPPKKFLGGLRKFFKKERDSL